MRHSLRVLASTIAVLVLTAACAQSGTHEDDPGAESLALGDVASSVEGNVVTLPVEIDGIEIVKADGDASGDSGHFHVFIDREPVAAGKVIPKERGVVHSADNPIKVWGLEPGEHEFTVVVGDGVHTRIAEGLEDTATVDVEGPSVWGSAPATVEEGSDVTVELQSKGAELMEPGEEGDADHMAAMSKDDAGHFHVLVDPKEPPQGGDTLPKAKDGSVYHTADDSVSIEGLEKGEHIIWIVLGSLDHEAFDPPVMDKLTVTVT